MTLLLLLRNRRFHYTLLFAIITVSIAMLEQAFTLPMILGTVPLHYVPEVIGMFLLGTAWFAIRQNIRSALLLYAWVVFITPPIISFSSSLPLLSVILFATPIVAMLGSPFIIGYYVAKKDEPNMKKKI